MVWVGNATPNAPRTGYIYEHRQVMEQSLGRLLTTREHVHHKNHDRTDNRLENLELMDTSDHAREHILPRVHEMARLGAAARWGT
jgi:hypothetical protein